MSGDKRARLKQWLDSGEARLHPLTFPQRELWEASPAPVADTSNHICCLISVKGLITLPDCEAALRRVVERQEVLRLSFLPGKDRPLQLVRRGAGEPNLAFRELTAAQAAPEAIEELAQEIFREPFDLVQAPLYRASILRRALDDHVLVFTIHHAIADGWTLGVFVQDLFGAYLQGLMGVHEPLPPVPLSYTAWGAAERSAWPVAELQKRADFWRAALAGTRRIWSAREEGKPRELLRWVPVLPADLSAAAGELARRSGTTLFSTLHAAFRIALARWTGADDILVGTPVANRHRPAVRETMGYCSGIVPLRGQVDWERPFLESLQALHHTTVDAFANAMPFAELVQALADRPAPGYNPVSDVRFALHNHPVPDVALPTLSAKLRMRSSGTARFDLACEITEQNDVLLVAWLFRPDRFSQAEIEDLHGLFQAGLTNACRSPESRIAA
ncbi:MAG: condensation domain-containing protein [Verrucomicrobiota bacterium]|nr:condensation domain-containing protein [Verrucomicrobiota bacterium]